MHSELKEVSEQTPLKRRRVIAVTIVSLLTLAVTVAAIARIMQRLETVSVAIQPPLAVVTEVATPGAFVISRHYPGTVEAYDRVLIAAQLTSVVVDLPYREGSEVKEGTVLIRLDDRELLEELERLKATRERITSDLAYWRNQRARDENLYLAGTISERTRDETRRMVGTLEASLRENRETQAKARTRRGHTELRAPFTGIVQAVHILPGELAIPGKTLLELVARQPLKVIAKVPQSDLPVLGVGQRTMLHLHALDDTIVAKVDRLYPALDPVTRTATLESALETTIPIIRPGMQVNVEVVISAQASVFSVPQQAVRNRDNYTGVFVVRDRVAEWQPVRLGLRSERRIQVLEGVREGDEIIVTPDPRMADGRAVWIDNEPR